tara:strand:- start:2067 stop:2570 length:504 start_codon:yes stop_codon:yes gene_type:complete
MKQSLITIFAIIVVFFLPEEEEILIEDRVFSFGFSEQLEEPDHNEVIVLAKLLQSESFVGEMADSIATVVLNRKYSNRFPNTIKSVIFQRKKRQPQFDGIDTENFRRKPSKVFLDVAYYWLQKEKNKNYTPTGVVWYYTTDATDLSFVRSMQKYEKYKIQNTKFCGI